MQTSRGFGSLLASVPFSIAAALALVACSGSIVPIPGEPTDAGADAHANACSPALCTGPISNIVCADGSSPNECERLADGTCGWVEVGCPLADAGLDARIDAPIDTSSDTNSIDGGGSCTDTECGAMPDYPVPACAGGGAPPITCERESSGVCGWVVGSCPPNDGGGACTDAECGPMPVTDCPGGGSPPEYCERQPSGACAWVNPACPPVDGGDGDVIITDVGIPDGFFCTADACGPALPIPCELCADGTCAAPICSPTGGYTCGWKLVCGSGPSDGGTFETSPADAISPPDVGTSDGISTVDASFVCDAESCGAPPPGPCFLCSDGTCGALICTQNGPTSCGWASYCPTTSDAGSAPEIGPTPPTPTPASIVCGGLGNVTCPSGEYCDFPIASMCGDADGTGTCQPTGAPYDAIYTPVCGCDGKTYSNAGEAAYYGVSVRTSGVCGK